MKKKFYSTLCVIAFALNASAQCTPDPQYTSPGFYPDSTTGLAVACETVAYQQTITMVSPTDTVFQGFTIAVDSVTVTSVTGLPTGISADCQTASCTWYPQSNAASCLSINGTAVTGTTGTYTMVINYEVYVTLFGFVQSIPLSEDYTFEVQGCASLEEHSPSNKELVRITDLMGREIVPQPGMPVLYHYSDGTVRKMVRIEE